MQNLKKGTRKERDGGVSPVVGVMLMLVVTIIIAAVVSAFAGSSVSGSQKAPSATTEIHIKNGGTNASSYFTIKVLGVSEPIPTKNLKIVTSWTTTDKSTGSAITGGNTTYAGQNSATTGDEFGATSFSVPTGYGSGVSGWSNSTGHVPAAQWGNYTWVSGTACSDRPYHYGNTEEFTYDAAATGIDPLQAILGGTWNNLRQGDTVTVRIIHVPSGKEIADQQVVVEE